MIKEIILSNKDIEKLKELINIVAKDNFIGIDLGTYLGGSCSIICQEIKNYKNVQVYTIDNYGHIDHLYDRNEEEIKNNLLEYQNIAKVIVGDSSDYSKNFENNNIDFCFIDANHSYEKFSLDLQCWYPKIKVSGIICGHDCDWKFEKYTENLLQALRDIVVNQNYEKYGIGKHPLEPDMHYLPESCCTLYKNYIGTEKEKICVHGGILLGLYDFFGENFNREEYLSNDNQNTSIWYKIKE